MCPVTHSDRHDSPGLVGELGPGLATGGEDLILRGEDVV